jgi:hypothetical protein
VYFLSIFETRRLLYFTQCQEMTIFFIVLSLLTHFFFFCGTALYSYTIDIFAGGGSSLADGVAATSANITLNTDVFVDINNTVYIVDQAHDKVRYVDSKTNLIYTLAGTGVS